MSIFNNNVTNNVPLSARVGVILQETVDMVVDRVNNHFGQCKLVIQNNCLMPMSTHISLWNELKNELELLNANDKYKDLCIFVHKRDMISVVEKEKTTEYKFNLLTSFCETADSKCGVTPHGVWNIEIPCHAEINNTPNFP
jgi:hypothetical protein